MAARRRMVCAASALAGILSLASSAWGVYVQDFTEPGDFSSGTTQRVIYTPELGGLVLNRSANCVPFLWVPSPRESVVSKIDARTGHELARYRMGPEGENWSPCAVASDSDGNAYVACTCPGQKGRVVRIASTVGKDRDGNGVIATSGDADGNYRVTSTEILPWRSDERVGPAISVGGDNSAPSSLAFDRNGYLWVALSGERSVVKVNIATGAVVSTVNLVGRPAVVACDPRGSIWTLSRDSKTLCRVDTIINCLAESISLGECSPSGMCIDDDGKLWVGDLKSGLLGYQTDSGVWSKRETEDGFGYSAVAADKNGDIWATSPLTNEVAHFARADGGMIGNVPVGVRPGSVCADEDGYVWVLNEEGDSATRIDVRDDTRALTTETCGSPSSNTPFGSCVVRKGICPEGTWQFIADSEITAAGWGRVTWQGIEAGGSIKFDVRSAETTGALPSLAFQRVANGQAFSTADGRFLEVRVTLTSNGDVSPVLSALRIEGVNRAPDISRATPTISCISEIDHGMEEVGIAGITDPEGDPFTVTITRVTQDEPVSGLSDEDLGPDATGVGGPSVNLRREMDLGTMDQPGNGRVYVVSFRAVDALGATSTGKVKVTVPPGPLARDKAYDDGQIYDSTKEVSKNLVLKG